MKFLNNEDANALMVLSPPKRHEKRSCFIKCLYYRYLFIVVLVQNVLMNAIKREKGSTNSMYAREERKR